MILEVAILYVRANESSAFESAMTAAAPLIAAAKGFRTIEVRKCLDAADRYLLLVTWDTVEDHEIGFRCSDRYQEWRRLLHHFYDPFPVVEHYGPSFLSTTL